MSVRSDVGVCQHCGVVELAIQMVRVVDDDYVYLCQGCAVSTETRGAVLRGLGR